jgi:hypothetical protein
VKLAPRARFVPPLQADTSRLLIKDAILHAASDQATIAPLAAA